MVIQVLFRDPRSGSEQRYEFDQSPVRIGRNPLNNIVLEGNFVSGWHGILRFDNTGTFYFDLGSTNGTCLDGKRLPKNTPVPIGGPTRLTIWMFELVVTPALAQPTVAAASPATPSSHGSITGTGRTTEVYQVGSPSQTPHTPSRIVSVGGRAPTPPPPTSSAVSRQSSHAITGRPARDQTQEKLNRCLRIIQAFAEAFMGLKKGYEQFGAEVGVRPIPGTTPLHRARTSSEVVDYVLDGNVDPESCGRDLNAVFADMGIHDVALMEGISQSVRSLLCRLDPSTLDINPGMWAGGKAKARWTSYVESFATLLAEDAALHAEIFGEDFAAAYASVALADDKDDQGDKADDGGYGDGGR